MTGFVAPAHCSARLTSFQAVQICSWNGERRINRSFSSFRGCFNLRNPRFANPTSSQTGEGATLRAVPFALLSGGGILGVGPSEVVVIIAVGWLLLGPEKLFSLAKDSGKLLGDLRRTAAEARETFSEAMDLDALAAEVDFASENKKSLEGKVQDSGSEDDASSNADENGRPDLSTDGGAAAGESQAGADEDFLEQLRRVSDPNQVAPAELPDLGVEVDELEVERLEKEYMAAKRRLESRRDQTKAEEGSGLEAANEDR